MSVYTLYNKGRIDYSDTLEGLPSLSHVDVSVVLPTYNEEPNIKKLISRIIISVYNAKKECMVLVVDDGSTDRTQIIVKEMIEKGYAVQLLVREKRGVFSAQLDGLNLSNSDIVVTMDADFSHPPEKITEMLYYLPKYDFVSGSRFLPGSKIVAPLSRELSTRLLNAYIRLFLGYGMTDYTSIFFAIMKDKWKNIELKYDAIWGESGMEILKEANRLNYQVKEIPFTYDYRVEGESKSENLIKYAWVYFKRTWQVKFMREKNGRKSK